MPEIENLYSVVKDNGLYTKSYDEFVSKYSNEQNMSKLYQVVYDQGLYTKSFDDFKGKYFTQVKKKESVSPSQQKAQPTSLVTGAMGPDGEPVSSASSSNKSSVPLWLQKQETPKPQATEESLPFMVPKPQGINLGSERVPEKGPMFGVGKPEFKEPEKIDKNLARLETSLVDMDEDQATEKLKYLFGDLGFTFDQAGYGYDAITVTSPSGKKLDLSWDNFSSKQDEYVLGQLTDFISKESKAPSNAAKLEKYYEESNKKFVDQREINETIATLSKKSDDVNKLIKGYVVKRDALENEGKVLEETPENLRDANWESRYNKFVENVNKLEEERLSVVDYQNNFERNKSDIDMAVGKYMQTEEKMGWWGGVLLNSLLKSGGRAAASGTALFIDGIVNIMPTESLTGDYPERFVDAAKKLGYKVEDYKKLKTSLSEDQIEEINDKVDDELKKELKYTYGTLETARETNVKALGSDNVTKQYEAKFKEGFFGGAIAGLAESLPSMLGPSPARVLSMYSNITDNVSEEMENDPTLSKLSETEKSLVSVPIGIVSAILEEFGLRNVVANKGLLNKLVMRMLGKVSPGVTSRTFAELVRNDVESMVARGLLTVGGAALAEFETGAAQEASEQTIKAIYNKVKGDDVFKQIAQTPYEFIGDMMYAGAQEAVGGFVLGSIPAVSAAYRKTGFEGMSDIDFEKFERIANDDKVESAFVTSLKTQINSGEISVEDAKQTLNDYRKSRGLYKQLPDNLTTENKKKAMNLLRERQGLDQQISGKDDALVKPQKARIEEINSLLETISKPENNAVQEQTTSEVPVQPGAAVSGEVAQGEPQAEPQVVTEEGQAQKEVIPAGKRLFNEPNPETVEISKAYKEKNGIVEGEGVKIEAVDVDNASKIADAFEALEDSPNDPEVQDAYNAMADETAKQHQDIIDAGYEVEIWDGEGEPYANAQEMIDDVKNNKHMYIFSTEQGFGDEPITDEQRKQNKLLQDSGLKDKNGKPLLYNDLFRFVHDFFGHTERGNGFGPVGEENAWDVHARMYSPKARRAMTTETRGQNSWVNFGPQMRNEDGSLKKKGDPGYLSPKDRAFAPQKMALMPEEFTQIKEAVSGFDQAVNNSAQSLKMVAPDLKIIVAENTEDAQLQIAEALSAVAPTQAADVAEGFTTETRGQTVFVNGKPFAIVLDKSQADSKTVGHEAWELMLNDAFGDDQAKFKEFRDEIDRQLRLNGFGDIADALTKFSNQRGYEDVKYSEYMAELGGMLVAGGFKQGSLDAKQKSLLQKIGDVINKFAQLFTGKKQFLDEATPDDILGFMITISNKVAKGEDVSKFFRGKKSAAKPSVETRSQQAAIEILDGPKFENKLKEDVASYLNSLRDSEIPPNSSREQLMERFLNNVYEEVGYYLYSKPDARSAGLTWYIEDMVEFANKVKVVLPELSDENQYKLFLTVLAFTSSGTNPNQNLLYAYNLWNNSNDPKNFEFSKNWAEKKLSFIDKKGKPVASGIIVKETAKEYTVELVDSLGRPVVDSKGNKKQEKVSKASMKPGYPKPTGYTNRGEIIVGQLEKLEKLYADLGSIDAVVKWLETPHPIAELRKYNESVPDVNGKGPGKTNKEYDPKKNAEGERNGAFIFGEKIGSFYQNMIGIGETITMDLWWSRTWNRYMGTMINTVSGKKEIQEVPRSDRERNIMREAVKMVAEDLNLQVSELQAAIWYFEQELWTKSGNESPSYSYVTAIDDLTKKLKVDEETRTKLRAAEADLTEAEKRRQNAAERAAAVVASKGGKLPEIKVTAKSQKSVPAVVDEVLTDDGKGNYVFVHYSDERRDTIKPMSGSKKGFTSREEVAAISSVGGVAMYYTKQGQKEQGVGNVAHTVLVPKDKVYFYGTTERGKVSNDPENFYPEARRRFQEYKNRGNEGRPTEYAFDSNNAAAWVGKVAAENGYDMLVTNWGAPTSYRAQTVKELTPETDYTGFKEIPEPTYEVGDEVFLYGKYAVLTDVKPDVLTYEVENALGGVDTGKFPLTVMTRDKIIMIQKAKPVITVRAQKKDTYTNEQYGEMSRKGIIFHAGTKTIEKLDPSKIKGGFRAMYGWGVYFAKTIFKASEYGDMITFLDSKQLNFLNVSEKINSDLLSKLKNIEDKNIYYGMFLNKLKDMVGININEARLRMGDFIRWDYDKVWSQMFMDAGYDGFSQSDNEYVVFNIEKADQAILEDPLTVTTKSQKVVVNTIPGYERFLNQIEGMMDKGIKNGTSYNKITENVIEYIQRDSAVYERADDSQREQIIRDFLKIRGEKFKVAPSVGKILGQIKDVKKVTVNEKTALKEQIKLEAKAAKDAVAFVKQLRMQISGRLKMMAGRGVISAKQASAILARYDRMNILNPDMRDRFVDYMANVFESAEYADKVKEANKLRKTIRKAAKSPDNQAESSKLAKTFAEIDPSRVENIDDYLNNAEQILKAVSRKTGDVKMRSLVNMTDMVSYIDKEIQEQRKQIKNEILSKYQDLVDAGVLDSKMTINEINKVVAAIEENEDESAAKAKEAKAAVKQMMDEVSPILLQIARTGEDPFTGDPIDLTQDEKSAIVKLAKMDLDNLSLAEAVKALEYANNFIANGVTSGIVGMVDLYEGSLNAEKLAKKGFKSIPFKKYFSKVAGRIWAEQIASLPMLNKLMWGSTSRALEVSEASGVTGVSNGKAKAIKIVEKAVKEYVATFSKVKDFLSSENVVERGMLAFVSRTVIGDEFQAQDEFNRRKSLIEETIQALKDPENSTDAEIKKGEVVEKVYNKILKDAKNAKEVRANVSEINKKAVDWWVNEWSKHYDRMDEVSRNVYNTLLSRDANFTPDRFQLKEVSPAAEEDFDSGFFGNFENVSTEKSGSLKENKRIKNLPQNKNGVKTRIVNLDFDVNNVNALTNAMVDVETAGSVMQMKGFVTSKDFSKLFASKEDKNVYKKRLVSYVNRAKGQGYVDQSELKTLNRLVNTVASFGTAKALFSLSQPFKQSIPPLFNTLVQTGRLDLGTLMVGGFSFIDRTGYPIANRGISSQGELKSINRQLVEAEKNLLLRGVDGVAAYSNLMLELTLKYPDIMTARSSWLSFYKKGLKKEGIKTSGINWNTHEVNKKAADYAQMMVDSQQNISDSDMQGEFMASKDPAKAFLRRAIFPLMTFVLNQKTRIWADVRTLSNKAVTTTEDRQEAALSLAGALVELGAFSAISYAANSMLWEVAMNILAAVSGEDDDDDREEEKKKMILRRSAYTAQNFMKDFFVPPIPGADLLASKGINYILDETNLSSEIPADWFGIEDDRVKFRLYDKENQGYLDMLGTQGIALEKALELADYYDMAIDGTFKEESYGAKREKQILEGDADMARINAAIMTGYYGGLLPADVAYIVGQINKKIKKRAEVVEEED